MGIVDKINHWMNPDVGDDYDDQNYLFDENNSTSYDTDTQTNQNIGSVSSNPSYQPNALELKVVKPERFEDASVIADHLLSKRTIVLNLEDTNSEVAKRLIDFLSGVAYSIDGNLKKVADHTFVITPNNVMLSSDKMAKQQPAARQDTFGNF